MEGSRFDGIARLLGRATSRRQGVRAALTAAAVFVSGGVVAAAAPEVERCLQVGQRCGRNSGKNGGPCAKCCTRYATSGKKRRRCTCRPDGMRCGNSGQCCNGSCNPATKTCLPDNVIPTGGACSIEAGDVCAAANATCQEFDRQANRPRGLTYCLVAAGQPCSHPDQCVTGVCFVIDEANTYCCGGASSACAANNHCCPGYRCDGNGRCIMG